MLGKTEMRKTEQERRKTTSVRRQALKIGGRDKQKKRGKRNCEDKYERK